MPGIPPSQATRSYRSPGIDETAEPIGQADPGEELGDRAPAPPADASAIYYCPNLPKVDQIGPGNCQHCGSPLEPRNPIAALEED